jgi:Phosducin
MSTAQDEIDGLLARNKGRHAAHPADEHHDAQTRVSDEAPEHHHHHHHRRSLRDRHDHSPDSDGSGAEQDAMPTSTRGYTVPVTLFSANTGPKGVIADAQSFEKAKHSSWRSRLRSNMTKRSPSNNQFAKELAKSPAKGSIERSDLSSDDDEEFMREWRKHRLRELQTFDPRARRRSPSKRKYGRVEVVDASGYLDAVEKVGPETVVVVTIYDDEVCTTSAQG